MNIFRNFFFSKEGDDNLKSNRNNILYSLKSLWFCFDPPNLPPFLWLSECKKGLDDFALGKEDLCLSLAFLITAT